MKNREDVVRLTEQLLPFAVVCINSEIVNIVYACYLYPF